MNIEKPKIIFLAEQKKKQNEKYIANLIERNDFANKVKNLMAQGEDFNNAFGSALNSLGRL